MKRTIVIWGAGRIGRGFVADIFNTGDWRIVFVDKDQALVDALNCKKSYPVYKATRDGVSKSVITGTFEALYTDDILRLSEIFLADDLLLDIALHEPVLPEAADMIAPLIRHRAENKPDSCMDIMMNVNMPSPDERFRELLSDRLSGCANDYLHARVGLTGIFAMCISPIAPDEILKKEPLALWNNGFHEQAIGQNQLKCPPPILPRLRLTDDVSKEETRKLYTLNMAHALSCYLGLKRGLVTAREAALDDCIRPMITGALKEASIGLTGAYGFSEEEMQKWEQTIIALLENPYIEDKLQRLGADSRRKLGAYDRLVGPARLAYQYGKQPDCLLAAIRAGFDYENDDEGTKEVRAYYKANGLSAALTRFSGLSADSPLGRLIMEHEKK